MQPADYGFELNEFDPFFNFRATKFIVDNGYVEYFAWHDNKSWYPDGRNVSATSQVMLHITTAALYQSFGMGQGLYDFTILFPVIIGSLTTIVIFAMVRVLGGTTAGLLASLFFAVSMPVIIRGTVGWFKSEPLGLFYGFLGVYLFLSGIKSDNGKISFFKLIAGGIFVSLGISSWGGSQFFVILLVLFFLGIPFLRKDKKFITWALPVFVSAWTWVNWLHGICFIIFPNSKNYQKQYSLWISTFRRIRISWCFVYSHKCSFTTKLSLSECSEPIFEFR